MKKITKILFVLVLSFFLMKNVNASLNYLSVDNLDDAINEAYTGLVKYEDNYYYLSKGEIIKNEVVTIDNEDYYFNNDGIMEELENEKNDESNDSNEELNDLNMPEETEKKLDEDNNDTNILTTNNDTQNEDNESQGEWQIIDENTYYIYPDGTKATGWVVIDGIKCYFNELGQLIEKNALKIIDVSHHNGTIDWEKVKTTDVDGAIIRLGYGTSYTTDDPVIDRQWNANYDGTVENDLLFGIYLYSYAIDEISANLEADFVIDNLNKKNVNKEHIIYYDIEDNPWTENLSTDEYDTIINTFTDRLTKEGYQTQVYSYKWYAENKLSANVRSKLSWIAQYYDICTYTGTYNGWQYTANGTVEGINGHEVDISVFKNISNKVFDHLELDTSEPLDVEEGIIPDLTNLVVYKVYTNGDKERTNDFIYDKIAVTKEIDNIEISYTEDNITSTIQVPIKVIEKNNTTEEEKEEVITNIIVKTQGIMNPKTSDNINLYFQLLIISILGIICSIYYKKIYK